MRKVIFLLIVFCIIFLVNTRSEADELAIINGQGSLVIYDRIKKIEILNAPVNISTTELQNLVNGKVKKITVNGSVEKFYTFYFSEFYFPKIIESKKFSPVAFSYNKLINMFNEPESLASVIEIGKEINWPLTVFWLIIPAVWILVITLQKQFKRPESYQDFRTLEIIFFHILVFCLMAFSGLVGLALGQSVGFVVGGSICIVSAGMFMGGDGPDRNKISISIVIAMIVGMIVGGITGWIAGYQGYKIVGDYLLFIFIAMIIAFSVARTILFAKPYVYKIKFFLNTVLSDVVDIVLEER